MATITTGRPNSTLINEWTLVDTSADAALADDNDATYVQEPASPPSDVLLQMQGGTVSGLEKHRFRGRCRAEAASTSSFRMEIIRQVGGEDNQTSSATIYPGSTASDISLPWVTLSSDTSAQWRCLLEERALVGGDDARVLEVYLDIDHRAPPSFTPQVQDGNGVDQSGGTVSNTNQARLVFGPIARDGLVARSWTVEVEDSGGAIVFSDSGNGSPPSEITTTPLADDTYTARFQAFSTIRVDDAFASDVESVSFTVSFVPPNAPACTVTPTADPPSIEVCWTDPTSPGFSPGDTEWDDESEVVSEVRRTDCNGTETIYVALTYEDCHVDRFMGLSFAGSFCGEDDHVCQVCYEVRWWGRIDGILVATEWSTPCCVASIDNPEPGCDWLRGASSGDICICTDRSYDRTRPFGSFQPIGGGLPTVVTGTPGGRNYTLSFPVESEADLELVESILDQPLNYFQPDDQRDLWMAPNPESVNVTKIKRLRVVQASFVEVEPNPLADPASLVPPASGSPSSP